MDRAPGVSDGSRVHGPRGLIPAKRLRPVRHARQRPGVVRRLVLYRDRADRQDPKGPPFGLLRAQGRGGGWADFSWQCTSARRTGFPPDRCAERRPTGSRAAALRAATGDRLPRENSRPRLSQRCAKRIHTRNRPSTSTCCLGLNRSRPEGTAFDGWRLAREPGTRRVRLRARGRGRHRARRPRRGDRNRHEQRRGVPRLAGRPEAPLERGVEEVEVVSDSELLVKQMRGEYKVKNEALRELVDDAEALARRLKRGAPHRRPPRAQRAGRPARQRSARFGRLDRRLYFLRSARM